MTPKIMPRFRINTKILLTLLGLSLISLISFAYDAFTNMKRLGHYALESNTSLGERAVNDSKNALIDEAEKDLLRLAKDQAALSNTLFEKVEMEVDILAHFAATLWNNPSSVSHRHSYSLKEKPDDIYAASVYTLAPGVTIDAVIKELNLSNDMDNIFIPILANDPNLHGVGIGTESGIIRTYPWTSGIEPSYDPRKRGWYQTAVKTGAIHWTELYVDAFGCGLMVTCSQPAYGSEGEVVGVVAADVTLKAMNERIINTQVGELGYAFLIDNNGKVIARPGLSAKDKRWDESFETENLLHSDNTELRKIIEDMTADNTGIARCRFEDGEKYIAYAPVSSTDWNIGIVMPVEEIIAPAVITESKIIADTKDASTHINKQIKRVRNTLGGIFIVTIFVVSGVAYWLSKKITRPILTLNDGAKIVGSGDLDYHVEVKTGDEIEDLANAFNKMTNDLKIYIKNLKETTAAKERIESELKIAAEIQASLLPRTFPPFPKRKEFDIFATMDPAKEVGGDFYDFFFIDENKLCFLIGDVSGKGVPASLFMAVTRTLIKTKTIQGLTPDIVLSRVNEDLCIDNDACMFVTMFYAILNIETGEIQFANAGHNPPLIYTGDGDFEFIPVAKSFVVGAMENTKFESQTLTLKPNDVLFIYTDGVTEAMNPEGQLFSEERLKQTLAILKDKGITDIIHGIRAEIDTFAQGTLQSDDITMLALKFNG